MRKKPYTTKEFFNKICELIVLPDVLDYHLASHKDDEILDTYEFDFDTYLNFGSNEGIYLFLSTQERVYENGDYKYINKELGTFKTLLTTKTAMESMGKLAADFIYEAHNFVNDNIDDFSWRGYQITKNGTAIMECGSKERAVQRVTELRDKYKSDSSVVFKVIDLSTRKETRL